MSTHMDLVWPGNEHLPGYVAALQRGWSPDNLRPQAAQEQLARIANDADRFLGEQVDREANGPRIVLPNGDDVPRLPGYAKWMWDGQFCGAINFRWQPGTTELPPHCLGHIGYAVVPWKRRRGYATRALELMLVEASNEGLPYVEIVVDAENLASRKVVEANGGELFEQFQKPKEYGDVTSLRYRIEFR